MPIIAAAVATALTAAQIRSVELGCCASLGRSGKGSSENVGNGVIEHGVKCDDTDLKSSNNLERDKTVGGRPQL